MVRVVDLEEPMLISDYYERLARLRYEAEMQAAVIEALTGRGINPRAEAIADEVEDWNDEGDGE